tara:strand:+ start:1430 stop:1651 length:222 start_codon:yes stop_codon:yes gene_type:complete
MAYIQKFGPGEKKDPKETGDRENQIQKRYPGAVKRKDKVNEYSYKGVTLSPSFKQKKELSDAEKIKKAINEKK